MCGSTGKSLNEELLRYLEEHSGSGDVPQMDIAVFLKKSGDSIAFSETRDKM